MAHHDRLTALDTSFLRLEAGAAHMHVASVLVFGGEPPAYEELVESIDAALPLVPRYRQKVAEVPLSQGRPVWVDDPHFNLRYHVRHSALPAPGSEEQLRRLAARLFSQRLDRNKPLWEMNLVEGLEPGPEGPRFAVITKTHHALVDGISGVDLISVVFDASPDGSPPTAVAGGWVPRPEPTGAQLVADALVERSTVPAEAVRGLRSVTRGPRRTLRRAGERLVGIGAMAWAGMSPAPPSPFNVPIGPHRRYAWVDAEVAQFKAIKDALGGTLNDVVLAAVTLALGRFLRRRGELTDDLVLKAMVPVSVRADAERGALGNRVSAVYAPLPVSVTDARTVFETVSDAMRGLKESGQAVGAESLLSLADFAPPTIMSQAARLQSRQRFFNVVVTNVPGPQLPLYLLGRELEHFYPVVPLAENTALGIAIMSYNGRLAFGLLGDYDAMADLDALAADLDAAITELARTAGVPRRARRSAARRRPVATPAR